MKQIIIIFSFILSYLTYSNPLTSNTEINISSELEKYYEIFDEASERALNIMSTATDAATVAANIGGAFWGMGGVAVGGTNMQLAMQRIQAAKARVDQLKEFKRNVERAKNFSTDKLKELENLINDINNITENFQNVPKSLENALNFNEVEEILGVKRDNLLLSANNEVYSNLAGDNSKKFNEKFNESKEKIAKLKQETVNQGIEKLNNQLTLVITLLEKVISDNAIIASNTLAKENALIEEEIARKKLKEKDINQTKNNIKNLRNKNKKNFTSNYIFDKAR